MAGSTVGPHLLLSVGTFDVARLLENFDHCFLEDGTTRVDLCLGDGERRHETESVGTAGDDEQATLASGCDDRCGIPVELHAEDQALAADFLHDLWEALVDTGEVLAEAGFLLENTLLELGVGETADDVVGESGAERVAAEGCAVVSCDDLAGDVFCDYGGANGEAIAQCLCCGQDIWVGFHGQVAVSPQLASTAETALDLVVDEDRADLVAALPQRDQELMGSNVDTTLALDGLDNDTASVLGDQLVDAVDVVVDCVLAAGNHRREGLLIFRVGCHAQRSHGAAVERAVERDDLML